MMFSVYSLLIHSLVSSYTVSLYICDKKQCCHDVYRVKKKGILNNKSFKVIKNVSK